MYESTINQILGEIQVTYENECMKAVQSVGFDVNKEELIKALMYDRNQYEKGYREAIDDFVSEIIKRFTEKEKTGEYMFCACEVKQMIADLGEELKR